MDDDLAGMDHPQLVNERQVLQMDIDFLQSHEARDPGNAIVQTTLAQKTARLQHVDARIAQELAGKRSGTL